jgi:hypothetical protein
MEQIVMHKVGPHDFISEFDGTNATQKPWQLISHVPIFASFFQKLKETETQTDRHKVSNKDSVVKDAERALEMAEQLADQTENLIETLKEQEGEFERFLLDVSAQNPRRDPTPLGVMQPSAVTNDETRLAPEEINSEGTWKVVAGILVIIAVGVAGLMFRDRVPDNNAQQQDELPIPTARVPAMGTLPGAAPPRMSPSMGRPRVTNPPRVSLPSHFREAPRPAESHVETLEPPPAMEEGRNPLKYPSAQSYLRERGRGLMGSEPNEWEAPRTEEGSPVDDDSSYDRVDERREGRE